MTRDIPLKAQKRRERERMAEFLGRSDVRSCKEAGMCIADRLPELDIWETAKSVLVFISMEREIDTEPIIRRAFNDGKIVGIPRIHGKFLRFHTIPSLDVEWEIHPYGVSEAPAALPFLDPADADSQPVVVITPGVAFDRFRNRLGHGGGFYDKFFSDISGRTAQGCNGTKHKRIPIGEATGGRVVSIAVCATCQIVEEVPCDTHDHPVDLIMTENGLV